MKAFTNIFCIIKTSSYERLHSDTEKKRLFQKLSTREQELMTQSHKNQKSFIHSLQKASQKYHLNIQYISDQELQSITPEKTDLILSCGGDGTFLSCAQEYGEAILLGLNSDYQVDEIHSGSYGALTSINCTNLEERLQALIDEHYMIQKWGRLEAKINNKKIQRFAVNDIFFGQKLAYQTCEISVEIEERFENFQCSGMIACTGMGSHAWYSNAGGSSFSNYLDAFGFRILIPNIKHPLQFTSGVLSGKKELIIYPRRDNYILSFDSKSDVIETRMGDEIKISLAENHPIRVISFPNKKLNAE